MTLNELKKNNLLVTEDLKAFVKEISVSDGAMKRGGPATISGCLFDALVSGDENFSAQVWFLFMSKLSTFFDESNEKKTMQERFDSYLSLVKTLVVSLQGSIKTIEYMKNIRKWAKLILIELSATEKVPLFVIDEILFNELNGIIDYAPLSTFLGEEDKKTQVVVSAYRAFVKAELEAK